MKKLMLCAAVAVLGFTTVNAQAIRFGAKAGVNFANLSGDDVENADGRTGLNAGLVAEIGITETFKVQPEVLYSQQGLQEDFQGGESKLKLDYINVPVMAKYYVAEGFALEAGPQFGFNISSKYEIQIEGQDGEELASTQSDVEDGVEAFDFGIGGGVSYTLPSGLFVQARYVHGLTSVYQGSNEGVFQDDLNNSNLSVSIGYFFN
ncbi:PorT family protein [Subsaximicrobium wynnwilliamsii]|uniref:PorT family protein n=1 Tax=Subsaximicrobium wynnwilliamsii TaxID=291179 RepID=A0A5C6ZP90_9FLAO|nr:porin family protein [Subsaximicrobium wynnwilliamsii]TXD85108.1 PorT family protein [Subsaximicrobium wynnwilliamsii]TXD91151.1 PorT family protein [Subsaximicrobium wynnwilliamsii]TXE04545.1 PorT family protein [Subsaximicrobium wynnwilliamsii]